MAIKRVDRPMVLERPCRSTVHRRLLPAVAMLAFLVAFVSGEGLGAQQKAPGPSFQAPSDQPEYVPGVVIIKYHVGTRPSQGAVAHAVIGARSIKRLEIINGEVVQLPEGMSVESGIDYYMGQPGVEYAEPDYILRAIEQATSVVPNDPRFNDQWGPHNTGQTGGTPDADIDAPEAWDIQTGDATVIVGVIDTGVDTDHADLADNIWTNPGETPDDGIDNDENGFVDDIHGWDFANDDNDPADGFGHGTHVAGTIGAVGNNSVGVTGVAWRVQLMALKFLTDSGSGSTSDAVRAVQYATDNGARLTSNSWGGGGFSQALRDAIEASGNAGMLFVAAAGNGGSDGVGDDNDLNPVFPASYDLDNIVAVAATDDDDNRAVFSNFGPTSVDIGAPGVAVISTVPNNGYAFFSGTSMATPHVSGVAALVHSQLPSFTPLEVKERILSRGDPIPAMEGITSSGRRLNAFNALENDEVAPDAVSDLMVVPDEGEASVAGSFSLRLSWTATGDDGSTGKAAFYDIRYSKEPIDDTNFDQATPATGEPRPGDPGTSEAHTVTGLDFGTEYFLAIKVVDNVGNASDLSNIAVGKTDNVEVIFFDDAETDASDAKWTAGGSWARTNEDASPDGAAIAGGSFSWTDSPGGNYGNNVNASLTSVPFSLEEATGARLFFDHIYDLEVGFDSAFVEISTDGAAWNRLLAFNGSSGTWTSALADLSAFDGQPSVQIRYRIETDFSVTLDGWHIDDVFVVSQPLTRVTLAERRSPIGEPATLGMSLSNADDAVAGVDYRILFSDPLELLTYTGSQLTDRTTGFSHDADYDVVEQALTGILFDPGGGTIEPGSGDILVHGFDTRMPDGIVDLPVSAVTVEAPDDPDTGLPRIFFGIDAAFAEVDLSDEAGTPLSAVVSDGRLELDLLNTDVDFSAAVDVADIVTMVDFFLERADFTELQFLVADARKDDEINVIDVVRGVNIILDRPIGDEQTTDLVAMSSAPDRPDGRYPGEDLPVNVFLESGFQAAGSGPGFIELVADVPENIVGLQITVQYDPEQITLSSPSLALDPDHYRLATRRQDDRVTFMVYSLSNRRLDSGIHPLLRFQARAADPFSRAWGSEGGFELERALAVDASGRQVSTNVTAAVPELEERIEEFELGLSYPNPFTPATGTRLDFEVPVGPPGEEQRMPVRVRIYTLRGTLVRTLLDRSLPEGRHSVTWDGKNESGSLVSSGIYLLVMEAGSSVERRRLVFVR